MSNTESVEEFLSRGGSITTVEPEVCAVDDGLRNCQCGCEGSFTDHQMRKGECGDYGTY